MKNTKAWKHIARNIAEACHTLIGILHPNRIASGSEQVRSSASDLSHVAARLQSDRRKLSYLTAGGK